MEPKTTTQMNGGNQSETKEKVKQAAQDVQEKAVSAAGQAKEQAKDEARSTFSKQKGEAVQELHGVAQALRMTGSQLREQDQSMVAQYSNKIADQVERMSGYLETRNLDEVMHEAEGFARRQPEIFLGGAFTLGLLATRFFKSSASDQPQQTENYLERRTGSTTTTPSYSSTSNYTRNPENRQSVSGQSWNDRK